MEDYTMVAEDNLVMLSNGATVNRERLKPSDTVLGWNGNKFVPSNITKIELSNPEFVYAVEVGNKTVTVAKENGFWLDGGVEIFADKLTPGVSMVYVKDGDTVKLEMVTDVTKLYNEDTVYTICGTTYRNFISNGILLHNFDPYDYIGFIGNGALPFPLYGEYTGADFDDVHTTFRATRDAMNKSVYEALLAAGPIFQDSNDVTRFRGSGWKLVEGSDEASVFINLYESWLKADATLWNTMAKAKLYFSKLAEIDEYFGEGTLELLDTNLKASYGTVPNDYTGGQASFEIKEYVKRNYLYVKDMSRELADNTVVYTLTDEDKVLNTDTYFDNLNRDIENVQTAIVLLLNSVGCIGNNIQSKWDISDVKGTPIGAETYPVDELGNISSPFLPNETPEAKS